MILESDELADTDISIPPAISELLTHNYYKEFILNELLIAKKNLQGSAGHVLKSLYEQLSLNNYSQSKLKKHGWHHKVKGIQELAEMEQVSALHQLYPLINSKNEALRGAALSAIVKLSGFEGLKFIENLSYPLSEWLQINLLNDLPKHAGNHLKGIEKWLLSSNTSVVVFALKLTRVYQLFELYQQVSDCLKHKEEIVRIEAVRSLQFIYNESTPSSLIQSYHNQENKRYQLIVLSALTEMVTNEDIPFLLSEFKASDDDIKLAAGRTLLKSNEIDLESLSYSNLHPWSSIIKQIKSEVA
ncbi:HEAT repeat domain-containing protein [Solitalea longa]|uniref:HEAT repeat domain-containing protein n=1 Tax=Solitalea longa TaxID=2079460 RepID=UPI001056E34D|nr:hypothetical protein [Solitalea longa]